MGTVNVPNPKTDNTVRIFDDFYQFDVIVPANEYDAVNSFFESVYKSKASAQNFTVSLFRVAHQTRVSVMTLLQQIQTQDQVQLTLSLTYFLNGIRSPSTLLGVNSTLTPNLYTARNIRS
jgi:hypothetical protein